MTPSEVIDIYVTDVARNLPRKKQSDVAIELRELLTESLHARAEEADRPVDEALTLDMLHAAVEPGDVFLLCSDGLTGVVEDIEIEAVLRTGELEPAAEALMHLALERGARDNVTLVLIGADLSI